MTENRMLELFGCPDHRLEIGRGDAPFRFPGLIGNQHQPAPALAFHRSQFPFKRILAPALGQSQPENQTQQEKGGHGREDGRVDRGQDDLVRQSPPDGQGLEAGLLSQGKGIAGQGQGHRRLIQHGCQARGQLNLSLGQQLNHQFTAHGKRALAGEGLESRLIIRQHQFG